MFICKQCGNFFEKPISNGNDKDLESILCSPCCFGSFVIADKRILKKDLKKWSDK